MPGLDKSGPAGQGSQTGRGLGKCSAEKSTIEDAPRRNRLRRGFGSRFTSESEAIFFRGRGFRNVFRGRRRGQRLSENTNNNE